MTFSNNVWWTRKARIQAEKRLLANALQSEMLLLWYSFCGVAASIYYLKFDSDSDLAGISWVVYSVLILAITGFISGRAFKERAVLMKDSYVALKTIHSNVNSGDDASCVAEYEKVLGLSENHLECDYDIALCREYWTCHLAKDERTQLKPGFDRRPTWYHLVSVVLRLIVRAVALLLLYTLPIILFVILKLLP